MITHRLATTRPRTSREMHATYIIVLAALVASICLASPSVVSAQTSCPCTSVITCDGSCAGGQCCNFGCTDYMTDRFNCGSCGRNCGPMSTCIAGVCQCTPGTTRTYCYPGPPGTVGVGICRPGTETCTAAGAWGPCIGAITPRADVCNGLDDDCDGHIDNIPGTNLPLTRPCYGGPPGTSGVGACHDGRQICTVGVWGSCLGEVTPMSGAACGTTASCVLTCPPDAGMDAFVPMDAAGTDAATTSDAATLIDGGSPNDAGTDGGVCIAGGFCYGGPPGTAGVGLCRAGMLVCGDGGLLCVGEVLPTSPYCGTRDHDCDGAVDTACPVGLSCSNAACVPNCPAGPDGAPGVCPVGYRCSLTFRCEAIPCPSAPCAAGSVCVSGACVVRCDGLCAATATCIDGRCVPDGCRTLGCPAGLVCSPDGCRADACATMTCPADSLCRAGMCMPLRGCASTGCPPRMRCDASGACVADACAGVSCTTGQVCVAGACVADPCASVQCAPAEVCRDGMCVYDECRDVHCPMGAVCRSGMCFRDSPPTDAGVRLDAATRIDGGARTDAGDRSVTMGSCACRAGDHRPARGAAGVLAAAVAFLGLRGMRRRARAVASKASLATTTRQSE